MVLLRYVAPRRLACLNAYPGSHPPCLSVCALQEVGFYYMHRLFHRPWFYRHIHRVHHEVRHTVFTV